MQTLERIIGREVDAPINQYCGFHVHVYAADLTNRQLGRLYKMVHHYEAVLFRLSCGRYPRHRGYGNNFTYCRPLSAFDNPLEAKQLAKLKSDAAKESAIAKQKYVAANLMPVESLGTVEFRLWEGTRVARRMRLFSQLSLALVERALSSTAPAGQPLHLGDRWEDDTPLLALLSDLEENVSQLDELQLTEDATWQWENSPATWQESIDLSPLDHYDAAGRLTTNPERAASFSDGHGNLIELEEPSLPYGLGPSLPYGLDRLPRVARTTQSVDPEEEPLLAENQPQLGPVGLSQMIQELRESLGEDIP